MDVRMKQAVVGLLTNHPAMQRAMQLGFFGLDVYDCKGDDDDDDDDDAFYYYQDTRDHYGNINRRYLGYPVLPSHPVPLEPDESQSERKARLFEEPKKGKSKAARKRLKKQRQKEKKQQEKLEKEKSNPQKDVEEKGEPQQCEAEGTTEEKAKSTKVQTSSDRQDLSSDTDSSDGTDDSGEQSTRGEEANCEELDMSSTFVSKAALIVKRKFVQKDKAKVERKARKKPPVRDELEPAINRPSPDQTEAKENSTIPNIPSFEDNVKISTELGVLGYKYASVGQFPMAVKYFTDAIKYNPKEFKLFGNRSFCFEKMQEYEKSLMDAQLALSVFPGWVKGLYRKGRALAGLKRYEEAALAFKEVLKLDSTYAEATQELMQVQISLLMEYGFNREQSSNALIIHGTVEKSLEVLSKLIKKPGVISNDSANASPPPILVKNTLKAPPLPPGAPNLPPATKPLGPIQNISDAATKAAPAPNPTLKTNLDSRIPQELFPIWVGNLAPAVTEPVLFNLFNSVGKIHHVKLLNSKRCAFVNFTSQEHCKESISQFNGYELMGKRLGVRYPDRIPPGMGISKSALKATDQQDENNRGNECHHWNNWGYCKRAYCPFKHVPEHKGVKRI